MSCRDIAERGKFQLRLRWLAGLLLVWLLNVALVQAAVQPLPKLASRVTDQIGMLTTAERTDLEGKLAALESRKGSQIALLVVASTKPETIEEYAIRVASAWKLGRKGVDDGLLLVIARDDRALRIEVGYGLEGPIPDAIAKRVIEEIMLPRFKAGDMSGGIQAGVERLIGLIDGEPLPEPTKASNGLAGFSLDDDFFPVIMMFVFVIGGILRAIYGRLFGATLAGGVAFFGGWLLAGSILAGLVVALIVFILVLSGVGGVSLGGSGRGGGGFGGGGGGFGGGGASGRW